MARRGQSLNRSMPVGRVLGPAEVERGRGCGRCLVCAWHLRHAWQLVWRGEDRGTRCVCGAVTPRTFHPSTRALMCAVQLGDRPVAADRRCAECLLTEPYPPTWS